MWNVYLQTYLWGWLMSRSATVCFTDVFCIVFGLQWRNKIRQNVTFDVFWDQVVDFRAVGQKSRGDAVILLQRGIKTVKENKVTVEQHWSWSLCNPLVVPSRPEWRETVWNILSVRETGTLPLYSALWKEQDYSEVERDTSVWCIIRLNIIRLFGRAQSISRLNRPIWHQMTVKALFE